METLNEAKHEHPGFLVATHPECRQDIVDASDYVGSTLQIINYITASDHQKFLVCTEEGVLHEIKKQNPDKDICLLSECLCCPNMKKTTLDSLYRVLNEECNEIV